MINLKTKTELLAEREKILQKLRRGEMKYFEARPIIREIDAELKKIKCD